MSWGDNTTFDTILPKSSWFPGNQKYIRAAHALKKADAIRLD